MRSRYGSHVPQYKPHGTSYHREGTAAIGRDDYGAPEYHALPMVHHNTMHYGEHHHRCSKVVEVCRDNECHHRYCRKHALAAARPHQLCEEVEATVVLKYLDNRHRRKQKQHHFRCLAHILQQHILRNELLHGTARMLRSAKEHPVVGGMLAHHEIRAIAYIKYPAKCSNKDCNGSFVYIGVFFSSYEKKAN